MYRVVTKNSAGIARRKVEVVARFEDLNEAKRHATDRVVKHGDEWAEVYPGESGAAAYSVKGRKEGEYGYMTFEQRKGGGVRIEQFTANGERLYSSASA